MKRMFWLLTGVGLAAFAYWQGKKLLHRATPRGVAEQFDRNRRRTADRLSQFVGDVREAMTAREIEIQDALRGEPAPAAKYAQP